ncbi:MAG: hypothetical protein WKF70_12215 [Chitinophagaceae bacterium]
MKNLKKPSFLTFVAGVITLFVGLALKSSGSSSSHILILLGLGFIGVFWVWSIVMVLTAPDLKPFQKRFWMIAVIAVPAMGGLVFHIMHNKAGRITT